MQRIVKKLYLTTQSRSDTYELALLSTAPNIEQISVLAFQLNHIPTAI